MKIQLLLSFHWNIVGFLFGIASCYVYNKTRCLSVKWIIANIETRRGGKVLIQRFVCVLLLCPVANIVYHIHIETYMEIIIYVISSTRLVKFPYMKKRFTPKNSKLEIKVWKSSAITCALSLPIRIQWYMTGMITNILHHMYCQWLSFVETE